MKSEATNFFACSTRNLPIHQLIFIRTRVDTKYDQQIVLNELSFYLLKTNITVPFCLK